jgi:hypothetical protein
LKRCPQCGQEIKSTIETNNEIGRAARYRKANPFGGPAKVFDAMASRIRAGDDYHEVLKDYGFEVTKK